MDETIKDYAVRICDIFENLLDKHNIDIPDEERTGDKEACEARLFGEAYWRTEEAVYSILEEAMLESKNRAVKEIKLTLVAALSK